jgi:hypothetical protein
MKVKELIKLLQQQNPELHIVTNFNSLHHASSHGETSVVEDELANPYVQGEKFVFIGQMLDYNTDRKSIHDKVYGK